MYISHISDPPDPVFAELRERVTRDWKAEKGEELNEKFYANLRKRYTIVIEAPEQGDNAAAAQEPAQ